MNKILLTLMLTVVSSSALAEWFNAGTDAEGEFNVFFDPTTIRKKSNNKVKMWVMYDLKKTQGKAEMRHMSIKLQQEYDCKEEQTRVIYFSKHTKNMGKGKVVISGRTEKYADWIPAAPKSIDEKMLAVACKNN